MKTILITVFATIVCAESLPRCVPNSLFNEYCNTCLCSEDGKSAKCSEIKCESGMWNKDGTLKTKLPELNLRFGEESENICQPGNLFHDYCNTCICSADGKSKACTLKKCDFEVWNKDGSLKVRMNEVTNSKDFDATCTPGTWFDADDGCNRCVCPDDGLKKNTKICTRILC